METLMPEQKIITIYLTGWQRRMIADHVTADHVKGISLVTKIKIAGIIPKKEWRMYRPAVDFGKSGAWNLYLTDEQISHITEELGIKTKLSALNVSKELLDSKAIVFE
jgi:hypothetical protein